MIMISCFNDKIKYILKKIKNNSLTEKDFQDNMFNLEDVENCECPKCHAKGNFCIHGYYDRHLTILFPNNILKDFYISVTRVKCNSCGATHALLPNFIVPYKIFSFNFILKIVEESAKTSAYKVSEKFKLDVQLVYNFLNLFRSFFNEVDLLHRQAPLKHIKGNFNQKYFELHCSVICDDDFIKVFFKYYKRLFLMTKYRNNPEPKIYIGMVSD